MKTHANNILFDKHGGLIDKTQNLNANNIRRISASFLLVVLDVNHQ
ncbi:MAG: hypothetical protein R8L53_03395 [Mariprofundales bacterium]